MKIPIFILAVLLLLSNTSQAQTPNIKFNLVRGKDGISLGKINGITQGPNGYMWFADQTQHCITRFDGYNMISLRKELLNNNSLGGTDLESIWSDPSGVLWIGFNGAGLDRFDPKTGHFRHFHHEENDPLSLSNDTVNAVMMDHLGNLWVGTYGGLDLLDVQTGLFKHYRYQENDSTSLSNNRIRAIYEDRQGTIWVGAGSPFELERLNEGGLNRFHRETETFTRYLHDPKNPNTLISNKVRAIFEDSRGTFWVGTAGDGLHTMDRATGRFKRYPYNRAHPDQLSRPPLGDLDDHITFITEDRSGAIWIGTYKAGLTRYDPVAHTLQRFNPAIGKKNGFLDKSGWTAFTSRDGVLWLSTEQNTLYRIDPFYETIPHIAATGAVNSFYQEADGVLWIGTDSGLIRNDRNKNSVQYFKHHPQNHNSISNDFIMSISKDYQGHLWIGTNGGGLNKLNVATQTFTHYGHNPNNKNSLINDQVFKTLFDGQRTLWVGTSDGLEQFDLTTETFMHYRRQPNDIYSLSNNAVTDILLDRQKRLWVGTFYGGGLNELDPGTKQFKHYLPGLDINCIFQDAKGTIWAGTIEGLYWFDHRSETFVMFKDQANEVRYKNVKAIIEDKEKNLWIGTSDGIERLNTNRSVFAIYGKDRDVENSLNFMAGYKGLNNELFFGSVNGYYDFFPKLLAIANNKPPEILISDFRLDDKPLKQGQNSTLNQPLVKAKEIVLKYNQNTFSIDFAAIDYSNPDENYHLFKLENYDHSWRRGNERTAYYFNVPPGRYTFHVKAVNSNGVWAEKTITVIINTPWWLTWWAYALYVLLVVGTILGIIYYRSRNLRKELEHHKKEKQLAELQQQKVELEMQALRAQMNPHFIFNCLNSINHFILKNEPEEASHYLTKFSKLIRMVLNLSQKNLISLKEELNYLELYIQIEQFRFNNVFTYHIYCDNTIDTEEVMIPPLLLQPFVENAIWHGLMHKERDGVLDVTIMQEGRFLTCTITDNGIGRQKAAMLKSKSASYKKSLGIQITTNRLQMLNGENGNGSYLDIIDVTDKEGVGLGTQVIIHIPIKIGESIPSLN